jgi:hypothetical protein
MAVFQESVAVRNSRIDAEETTIGTAPLLKLYTGAVPVNCAAADPAGLLITLTLPVDWLGNAAAGVKSKAGVWSGTAAAAGVAASWRIKDSTDTTCHYQGDVTATGGGGSLTLDNTNIANLQAMTINTATNTAGNA